LLFLFAPLAVVFVEASAKGFSAFRDTFHEADALAAIRLTLIVAAISVPANLIFGLAAAWAICQIFFPWQELTDHAH